MLAALAFLLPQAVTPGAFVVIAPAEWEPALAPFVEARSREMPVELVALEDALAANEGSDAPERLKRFLYAAWRERGARYALLVGDASSFPVRFMALDRRTDAAHDLAFYASDLYYADLAEADGTFDDWNAEREGVHARYFGEVRGETHKDGRIDFDRVSYLPELALGRWPVSDASELAAVVAKTLAWAPEERAPRLFAVHADGWVDARERLNADLVPLEAAGWRVQRAIYGDEASAPTPERVLAALLEGVDLAVHVGHGSEETWHGCLGPKERDALAAARPAIYLSVGCSTGHFCNEAPYAPYLDEAGIAHRGTNAGEVFAELPPPPAALQPGRFDSTGLGERLLRSPTGGAVAYIGCATGAQPCALTLLDGFLAAAAEPGARVGDAWKRALAHYHAAERLDELVPTDSWYPPSVFFQGMKFLLFGDPTLRLSPAPVR